MTNPRETVFYHFLAGLPESQAGPPSKDQVFNVLTSHLFPSPDFARAAMSSANEETEGPTGQRVCGHVFVSGDVVYRCRNCGLDETCVMCATCFKATEHDGHDISISVTAGSGGCCDCGDAEAWKVPLKCKLHSPPVETSVRQEPLPEVWPFCISFSLQEYRR